MTHIVFGRFPSTPLWTEALSKWRKMVSRGVSEGRFPFQM